MPKTLMLVPALLMSIAWLTAQEYSQSNLSQTGTAASHTTIQDHLQGSNGKEAVSMSSEMKDRESIHASKQPDVESRQALLFSVAPVHLVGGRGPNWCDSNETRSGIFLRQRYTRPMRHLVDIGNHAEKEVIQ